MEKLNVDCLRLIFNELLTDKNSLHSCLFVNKEWCNIVVPILWNEYTYRTLTEGDEESNKKLLNTILSCLPSSSTQILSDNDIKLPSTIFLKPPLFNYISFCKFSGINLIVNMASEEGNPESPKEKLLEQEIYKLFVSQCKNIKELWWITSQPLPLFPGASACFSQLYRLHINVKFVNSNILHEMAQICKGLRELTINQCSEDLPGLISLIDAQVNLKRVTIHPKRNQKETCKELSKALARKGNTIINLYLGSIVNTISTSFLTSLINLKNLSIRNFEHYKYTSEEIKCLQQYLAISVFPDLEYLCVYNLSCFKELAMLIEKTNGNISSIYFTKTNKGAKNTGMLIRAIANNCPKIKILATHLVPEDFIHLKLLLLNCRYLKYVWFGSLDFYSDENDNVGDELLDILTEFSPESLTDINIGEGWKFSNEEIVMDD